MSSDLIVFLLVVAARFGVPLLILRYPLPAIVAALVIDAADQTIFQAYTDLDLAGYQGYDKALDVYYLAIAYLSTFRNWADPFAARVAQVLWYYRLVGVVAFELTEARALLLVFPNTFEYFFIAYEVVRLAWNPARLGTRRVIGIAAAIWVFVKLPQEWWIHIAQLDVTDVMKEDVFGVSVDAGWGEAISENLWFLLVIAVLAVVLAVGLRWAIGAAPTPDWPVAVDVERHLESTRAHVTPVSTRVVEWDVAEKALLSSLIAIIFAQVLPNTNASALQITTTVSIVVIANAAVSSWLAMRGRSWRSTFTQFAGMVGINAVLVATYFGFLRRDDRIDEGAAIFFLVLLTFVVTLYDRYRPLRAAGYPPVRMRR